jgi:mono/diheme cytochrome c family protein
VLQKNPIYQAIKPSKTNLMKKIITRTLAVLAIIILSMVSYVLISGNKNFDVAIPDYTASKDTAVIARGKYLAFGPAHCASCHTPMDRKTDIDKGITMPLQGGWELTIPPGTFRASNLTPDMETGIGKLTDGQLVRAMRYSVNHNNKAMFPFMPFQDMSEADVIALISFLRSQEPVKNKIEPTEYSFLGKALLAFGLVKPIAPLSAPPKEVKIDSTAEYGKYVAHKVANCVGCHTNRDLKTGVAIGPEFAGGLMLPADVFSDGYTFVTPNLTPDKETGIMAEWNEKAFISRFKAGRVHNGSQMPWGSFSRMNEIELKAVYRYLHALQPIKNKIAQIVYEPGAVLPEK